ncbi:hypothetical protein FOL46_008549 [Perkinsus olseni]|uniref:Uncharacterized protein n=1 Tax=Perkinsus olseni TaxID=32597 RepID=A0A7J6L6G8_PEROL|nr:hypothetical protein FOL46_008549 [Perkinsus olseni]
MHVNHMTRVMAWLFFLRRGLGSSPITREQIHEASATAHPRPSLKRGLRPVLSEGKLKIGESGQRMVSKAKNISAELQSWYDGIPGTGLKLVGPEVEGTSGPRNHYEVSSSGLYAIFDYVTLKSADEEEYFVLGMHKLRCLAKDEKGKVLDDKARVIVPREPIMHFKLAFPYWLGAEQPEDYQVEVRKPGQSRLERRRKPVSDPKEVMKRAVTTLYYGLAGAASQRKMRPSSHLRSSMEITERIEDPTTEHWLLTELCDDREIYDQGQTVAAASLQAPRLTPRTELCYGHVIC